MNIRPPTPAPPGPQRVLLFGASGTIGRAVAAALVDEGHEVTCFLRPPAHLSVPAARIVHGEATDPAALAQSVFATAQFDVVISCLASRSGTPRDAWLVDYAANSRVLKAAVAAGVRHMILLSAICVQKPRLAFQHAKLAFERELMEAGLRWSIVRPTAFFKSLSGQVERVHDGKPYLLFGDGQLTACKPISDADLAGYIAGCITAPERWDRILPIGGPGPAITPLEQGEALFALLGRAPRYRRVPMRLMDGIIGLLDLLGKVSQKAADKAEYARIGRYYATESMLVWDAASGEYRTDLTPETGSDTLFDHYARLTKSTGNGPANAPNAATPI